MNFGQILVDVICDVYLVHTSLLYLRSPPQVPGDGLRVAAGDGPAGQHPDHLVGAVAREHAQRQERLHHHPRHLGPHPLPLHHANDPVGGETGW